MYSSQVSPSRPVFWAHRSGMILDRFCVNLLCISVMLHFMFFRRPPPYGLFQQGAQKVPILLAHPKRMKPALGRWADMAMKTPKLLPARPQRKWSTHRLASVAGETAQNKTTSSASLAPRARTRLSAQLRSDTSFRCRRTRKPTLQRRGALYLLGTGRPLQPVDAEARGLRANHLTIHMQSVIAFPGCVTVSQGFF